MEVNDKVLEQADAFADAVDAAGDDGASVDLRSSVAVYRRRRANGDDRGSYAHGRAVAKLAAREGFELEKKPASKADLEAEIERRNEGRDDDALIVVPSRATKADLEQLLAADDDAQE